MHVGLEPWSPGASPSLRGRAPCCWGEAVKGPPSSQLGRRAAWVAAQFFRVQCLRGCEDCRMARDTGVGKSSIVCRFVQDHFDHNISPTIGASFMTKTVPCGNELHKFLIWDTAGQERFHSLAPMYYRGSAAAVIVYDITKQDSFHTLKKWVKELKEHGPENIVMAIAGNKCDLSDIRSSSSSLPPFLHLTMTVVRRKDAIVGWFASI
ncbi:hypothetical protein J1605_015251 [Eschrichtius robustus]|uniref:Ras-related protein Rab-31 n=1 Tax=Eschrichtius robustus TaxID=9764 RepID=A0AB34GC33_ESCRO|nr:hypothetical protein J1605_015251 [Eschrichtius robustus]